MTRRRLMRGRKRKNLPNRGLSRMQAARPTRAFALIALSLLMTTNGPAASRRVVVHGHRGARARFPENTIPAFQYAIRAGVDVLELDMAITRDNVVVVSHDPIVDPPVCTGPRPTAVIHELTLAEVKQWDCGAVQNPRFPHQ